jgi:hypothetical protein
MATPVAVFALAGMAWLPRTAAADPFAPEPFPLAVGNEWNYENARGQRAQVRVTDSFTQDHTIYVVQGYLFGFSNAQIMFYNNESGTTMEVASIEGGARPLVGAWYPWFEPGRRVEIPRFSNDCIHGSGGNLGTDAETVSIPGVTFDNARIIRYDRHPCADQDLMSEVFVPGIGLVARTVNTFVGETRWVLTSAIIDGQPIGPFEDPGGHGRAGAPTPTQGDDTWGEVKAAFAQ